jgi:hypothetical protein
MIELTILNIERTSKWGASREATNVGRLDGLDHIISGQTVREVKKGGKS